LSTFQEPQRECLNGKINELETNSKKKDIIDVYRTNEVKDEKGDLADRCSILNRWKNYLCQFLKVLGAEYLLNYMQQIH
jgi:hypothetical protein